MEPVRVGVRTADPITQIGLTSFLRSCWQFHVVDPGELTERDVMVVQAERMTRPIAAELQAEPWMMVPKVLLIDELRDHDVLSAVEGRVVVVLPRSRTSPGELAEAVVAAASGRAAMPPELLGRLLDHIRRLQHDVLTPRGLGGAGLTAREIDVLRLMADGLDTGAIAAELCYSERTVKNVVSDLTNRLQLRNRAHAVAYALQAGVI